MDADTVHSLVTLGRDAAAVERQSIHGVEYIRGEMKLLPPPLAAAFATTTLDGFVNMLEAGVDGFNVEATVIHVVDFETVQLVQRKASDYARRVVHLAAAPAKGITQFPYFNQWGPQQNFVIGLQAHFQPTDDLKYLLDLASHIDAKESVKQADTGVTQTITVQRGMAFKESVDARPRVTLKPFRTFRELDQPASDFIFRVNEESKLALFEADGGAWKIAAIAMISLWLTNRIKTSETAGLDSLPIIS